MEIPQIFGKELILSVWDTPLWGHTIGMYSVAIICFCLLWATIRSFRILGIRRLQKWANSTPFDLDNGFLKWVEEISPLFFAYLSLYLVAVLYLGVTGTLYSILKTIFILFLIFETTKIFQKLIIFGLRHTALKKSKSTLHGVERLMVVILWSIAFLMALSNFGVNVSTLVASLGIGGIAVAFAMQHILEDIFSSFSIYFDKPFEEGDYVVVGEKEGEIKQIGLKTTRIEALQGEEIIISNRELTDSCVNNFGKLQRRRVSFLVSVAFNTPLEKLQIVDDIAQKVVGKNKGCEFDRAWLKEIAGQSFDFEIVYYVNSPDYMAYVIAQEKINWGLLEEFQKTKIEIALPVSMKINIKDLGH